MRSRTAGKAAVSALLGLPAALLAHAFVFGSEHAIGGWLQPIAMQLGAGFAAIAAIVVGLGAARGHRAAFSATTLLLAAATWFATFELTEAAHAVPVLLCAVAIALAGAICALAAGAYARTVHAVVESFSLRARAAASAFNARFCEGALRFARASRDFSLFSRPPPALS